MKIKKCNSCKQEKLLDCFGNNAKRPDGKQPCCRDCSKARDKKYYHGDPKRKEVIKQARREAKNRNKMFLLRYLLSHPCIDCGESDPIFLDFDHVRGKKVMAVSIMATHGWSIDGLTKEIDKCEVRCVKCHRLKTAKEHGWYNFYVESCDIIRKGVDHEDR